MDGHLSGGGSAESDGGKCGRGLVLSAWAPWAIIAGLSTLRRAHYLNADFDLSLRPRARDVSARLDRQVRELSIQGLLAASANDAVLVRVDVPDAFIEYLAGCGIPVPRLFAHPVLDADSELRPFGWNREAIELNRDRLHAAEHPDLRVVRRVNARSFARELEASIDSDSRQGATLARASELELFLSRPSPSHGWIVKADYGNSGLGNRRLGLHGLSDADRRFVKALFAENDRIVVEPWLDRERDSSMVFDVPFTPESLRLHETVCTADGALVGAVFLPGGGDIPHFDELASFAAPIARSLGREGYFGPVCVDAFTYRNGDAVQLRPIVDVNCRLSMSDGAYWLWRALWPEQSVYYRFFTASRLSLAPELEPALSALGDLRFDRSRQRGVLLASPPSFAKLAVIFVAESRERLLALESDFRERFDR